MEVAEMAARLLAYRSRNEWGDPVEHAICEQAADLLTRLSAERDRLEKEAEALRSAVSVGLDDKALARAERAETERDALKADLSREREAYAVTAAVAESAKTELSALKARVAEVLEPFAKIGLPFLKDSPSDDSAWALTRVDLSLQVGASNLGFNRVLVGDLRQASTLHTTLTGEQK